MAVIALVSIAIAFCLQVLGYTGTCTQGANEPFLVGALLSFPMLVLSAVLLAVSTRRNRRRPKGSVLNGIGSLGTMLVAVSIISMNRGVARDTLWLGTSPCGRDYAPVGQFTGEDLIVGIIFVVLPSLIAILAALAFWTALRVRRIDRTTDGQP